MLASAFVARHRRMHCRGSDTAAADGGRVGGGRGERPRAPAAAPPPSYRMHGRRRATPGPRNSGSERRPQQWRRAVGAGIELEQKTGTAAVRSARSAEAGDLEETAGEPPSEASSAELCAVCLEELRGEAVAALPCSHAYHPDCLRPWLAVHRACPCCRAAVASSLPES